VPPGAIVEFVSELGVTTAPSVIQISRFEQTVRRYLERTVPRLMLVLDPVPVVIEDAEEIEVDVPFSPKTPEMGSHKLKFTPTVYIDRSDFREVCLSSRSTLSISLSILLSFSLERLAYTNQPPVAANSLPHPFQERYYKR
jgi:glutamyl/glutaminyl-tRNA synthetase